jgi:hypothetical protein
MKPLKITRSHQVGKRSTVAPLSFYTVFPQLEGADSKEERKKGGDGKKRVYHRSSPSFAYGESNSESHSAN